MKKLFSANPPEMVPFKWKLLALLKPISVTTRAALAISCQFCSNYLLSSTVVQLVFSNEHKLKIVSDCNYIHRTLIYKSSNSWVNSPIDLSLPCHLYLLVYLSILKTVWFDNFRWKKCIKLEIRQS